MAEMVEMEARALSPVMTGIRNLVSAAEGFDDSKDVPSLRTDIHTEWTSGTALHAVLVFGTGSGLFVFVFLLLWTRCFICILCFCVPG